MRKKAIIGIVVLLVCLVSGGAYVLSRWSITPNPPSSQILSFRYSTGGFGSCDMFPIYTVDLEAQVMTTGNLCQDNQGTTSTITQSQVDAARAAFARSGVRFWKESYTNPNVMDGWGFTLEITYANGSTQVVHAYYTLPPRWKYFEAGLKELGI